MFTTLTTLACVLAVANCAWNGPLAGGVPAASVPAGISEAACPNYPHCTNPNVAVEPNSPVQSQSQYQQPQYQPKSQYQQPQYQQPQYQQPQYQAQPQYQPQYQPQQPLYQPQQPQYQPQQYQSQPQQHNSVPYNQNALLTGEYTGDGDYRGEGLAESGAFGPVDDPKSYDATPAPVPQMPYNSLPSVNQYQQQQGYNNAPQHPQHAQPNNVPAGLDPSYCPNYPFCS